MRSAAIEKKASEAKKPSEINLKALGGEYRIAKKYKRSTLLSRYFLQAPLQLLE
jgi:hypothetical protein